MARQVTPTAEGSGSDGAPQASRATRTSVIYVMGAGRSGSTILGVALGGCDGVFYAGELDKWLLRSGVSPLEGDERARFWAHVREEVPAEDLFGPQGRALERSALLFKPRAWRRRRRLRERYLAVADGLFASVARTAGASHIVDSSHYPLRARELQRVGTIDLYLLLLVRDPHAVVASLARKDVPERSYGLLAANAYLWLTHLLCMWVFTRQPREQRLLVRHEDFLAHPQAVLGAILAGAGARSAPPELSSLRPGPVFQANRLVREQLISLREPRPSQQRRSRVTALAQWPLQRMLTRMTPIARARAPESGRR